MIEKEDKMKWYHWFMLLFDLAALLFLLANCALVVWAFFTPLINNDFLLWVKAVITFGATGFAFWAYFKYIFIIRIIRK